MLARPDAPAALDLLEAATQPQFHDRVFQYLCALPRLFAQLVQLTDGRLARCLDLNTLVREPRDYVDEAFRHGETDLLYRTAFATDPPVLAYLLGEVQRQPQAGVRFRFHLHRSEFWKAQVRRAGVRFDGIVELSFFACLLIYVGTEPWPELRSLALLTRIPEPLRPRLRRYLPDEFIAVLDLHRAPPGRLTRKGLAMGQGERI